MNYTLKNDYLLVTVSSIGGEIREIKDLKTGEILTHIPDPTGWASVSPVLFPLVSRLKDNSYTYLGKPYEMGAHGFTRKMELVPSYNDDSKITFVVQDSELTLKQYPFKFKFTFTYELVNYEIKVTFKVENKDDKTMYYMIGAHPSFRLPHCFDDSYIEFEKNEVSDTLLLIDNLISPNHKLFLNNTNTFKFAGNHDLIYDTIMLKDLKSNYLYLKSDKLNYQVKFNFKGWNTLAFWSSKYETDNAYICIEPWNIRSNFDKEITKCNNEELEPNNSKEYSYSFEFIK